MAEAHPDRSSVTLVQEAVDVGRSRSFVEERLRRDADGLLPLAIRAAGGGEGFVARVGPALGRHLVGVPVAVRLGECSTRDGTAAFPIRWEAVALEALFPVLDGTLLVSGIDETRCRLSIEASYRVPLDRIGEALDRAVLHRVAESTIRSFLERLLDALTIDESVGDGPHAWDRDASAPGRPLPRWSTPSGWWSGTGRRPGEVRRWSATTQTVLDERP